MKFTNRKEFEQPAIYHNSINGFKDFKKFYKK